jgi:hypothetical protein
VVSETLKQAVEAAGCTGLNFDPMPTSYGGQTSCAAPEPTSDT